MQKDNSTLSLKVSLRNKLLREVGHPIVMETHGGYGVVWSKCYFDIEQGVVMEKDSVKVDTLAKHRPTWAVYECDCVNALREGAGNHLPVNFVDIDPYGEPWHVIDAFFESDREFPDRLAIVVNDGLRQSVKMGLSWKVHSLATMVAKYGAANTYWRYLDICREMMEEKASQRNYTLTRWAGYYCGHAEQMTHYAAIFQKWLG